MTDRSRERSQEEPDLRHRTSRLTPPRLIGMAAIAAAGGAFALAEGSQALAATATKAPTLAVSFTPSEIGVTQDSGIAYTITNPNSSGSLSDVGFTDTLPSFTTVDDPENLSVSGCGSADAIYTGPAYATVQAADLTVKAGTPCVITVSVIANTPGSGSDTPGPLTYVTATYNQTSTAPAANETAGSLLALAAPTATITTPTKGAVYTYGEKVKTAFTCAAASDANGSTLAGCSGSDDLGNFYTSGQYLDTTDPGHHTLDVTSSDDTGNSTDVTVSYTVLANNVVGVTKASAVKQSAKFTLKVPGAGTLSVIETHGKTKLSSKRLTLTRAYTALGLSLSPTTSAGKRLVRSEHRTKVTLTFIYTPKGGKPRVLTRTVTLFTAKLYKPKQKKHHQHKQTTK